MGNPEVGISDGTIYLPWSCSYLTDHAAVVDIGYIELFDILNRNYTNYTRGYDPLMVWYDTVLYDDRS